MIKRRENIKISTYDVEQRILTYTYYTGEARRNSGTPLKLAASIQASVDDHIQINDHMNVATSELIKMVNCYFCTCKCDRKDDDTHAGYTILNLRLSPPQYFPENLLDELRETMINYLVMRTLQQWMLQQKPDEAVIMANETEKTSIQLRELMNRRAKPRKAKIRNKNTMAI